MSYISAVSTNDKVLVWERTVDGERVQQAFAAPHYLYIEDPEGEYESIYGDKATKLTFKNRSEYYKAKKEIIATGLKTFEADISAELRVLSNQYYNIPAPKLHVTMYDIEVDYDPAIGFSSVKNPYAPINAIAVVHEWNKQLVVFAVPPPGFVQITNESFIQQLNVISPIDDYYQIKLNICVDERELLTSFLAEIHDSDVICGWNSDWFDTPYVAKRVGMVLGKAASKRLCFDGAGDPKWREVERFSVYGSTHAELEEVVDLQGRIGADYLDLFKKYEVSDRGSFKLENISEEILVDENGVPMLPKLEYKGTLAALYRSNFISFIRYNIRDVEILHGFEERLGYVELANQMYHLSTGLFHHVSGTIKLADLALINYCHHELKKIVPTSKAPEIDRQIAGALVLLPQIGMHEFVGSIDINSLYPGAIRSINISPETLIGQFDECVGAFELIAKGVSNPLTLRLESGKSITKPANEWGEYLRENAYSISGYGTVFDQKREGIIPKILSSWYAERKRFQALKKEAEQDNRFELVEYYDRLQYVYKIKLNSLYGALTNQHFRFYDLRMGESTTGTGRAILRHQCRKTNEILGGDYNVNFPMYETTDECIDANRPITEALHGPYFKGVFESDCVIYGDTDSTYFKTYTDNIKDAVLIADAVAERVNNSYPKFMQHTFFCTPERSKIIQTGREIVTGRGIFVNKKRYILHILDSEGKTVDKMKIMGLDTKKTTLPKPVAKKLNGFVERLLKGETWDVIAASIVEYKDTLRNHSDIMDVGLPKGVKGVEKYTREYKLDSKTRLPGHVAASILYNMCIKEYHDTDSIPIMSGMKIKVFYIVGKRLRFKSIAIPTDAEVLPEWFLKEFKVDFDAHIERLVDNPLSNILNAIGKKTPTKHSLLVEEGFTF